MPIEYTSNSNTPLASVSDPPAYMRIEAKTGPKHGVQPAAKAIPISIEPNQFVTFLGAATLLEKLGNFRFNMPIMFNPKMIIIIPLIFENNPLFLTNTLPKIVAVEPMIINIMVNPITNANVLVRANFRFLIRSSSTSTPVIYIIYAGIIGSIHGEKKDMNPAPDRKSVV